MSTEPKRLKWRTFFLVFVAGVLAWFGLDVARFAQLCLRSAAEVGKQYVPANPGSEAIVVLTGDRGRIPRALELLRRTHTRLLIVSGAKKGAKLSDIINIQGRAENIQQIWGKIVLESQSASTFENAVHTGPILSRYGVRRIVLVTSEYHLPRALKIFHEVLPELEIIGYPVASSFADISIACTASCMEGIYKFVFEYAKHFAYMHKFAKKTVNNNPTQ
ncbi:MAG: YdcF family protein [Deltaproteobacteria bacterium]|nr:YdcF family protein [Deltaproteobacteria bacterium]